MKQDVLEKRTRILGPDHPDTISAMGNLAITLCDQGQLDKAASMQQDVLEKMRRIRGDEHPHTITARNNLSIMLRILGKDGEAVSTKQTGAEQAPTSLRKTRIPLHRRRSAVSAQCLSRNERRGPGREHNAEFDTLSSPVAVRDEADTEKSMEESHSLYPRDPTLG